MQGCDVLIEDPRWVEKGLPALARAACHNALKHLSFEPEDAELTVLGCNDARIAALNAEFRTKATPTNVLSWPAQDLAPGSVGQKPQTPETGPDGAMSLGDIALSFDTCAAEAAAAGLSIEDHTSHLIVHGLLHLLGYDHISDPDAALMEQLEIEILGKMGIDDPYNVR